MNTLVIDIKILQQQLEDATSAFVQQVNAFPADIINTKPVDDAWSAAQVADHITKSNSSISKALLLEGHSINRQPDERVQELRNVFLNFETKFKSPSFILPSEEMFSKNALVATLEHSISKLLQIIHQQDLSVMINHPAFGDITKLEIIHFVIVHTQRHTHQLQNIFRALKK